VFGTSIYLCEGIIGENKDLNDNWVETWSLYSNRAETSPIVDFVCLSSEMELAPELPMLIGRHSSYSDNALQYRETQIS
jgi:hypothetical protein